MNKFFLQKEHEGIGGLFFIVANLALSIVLMTTLRMSWSSQCMAIADNLAYIVAINTSSFNYTGNIDSYDQINPVISSNGQTYNPLSDFNSMLLYSGIADSTCNNCRVIWDKYSRTTRIQFSSFKTRLNITITPHEADSVIENY